MTLRNGSKITVLTSDPGTAAKDAGRLCMILPSGPGTEQVARAAMSNLGREFARRNWIVAVPVSPDGRSFFGRNGAMIPELIRVTRKDNGLGYGLTLLAGISNGGICALEIAGRHSGMFCGVIAVPGVLSGKHDPNRNASEYRSENRAGDEVEPPYFVELILILFTTPFSISTHGQ